MGKGTREQNLTQKELKLLEEYGFLYPWSPRDALRLIAEIERLRTQRNAEIRSLQRMETKCSRLCRELCEMILQEK